MYCTIPLYCKYIMCCTVHCEQHGLNIPCIHEYVTCNAICERYADKNLCKYWMNVKNKFQRNEFEGKSK